MSRSMLKNVIIKYAERAAYPARKRPVVRLRELRARGSSPIRSPLDSIRLLARKLAKFLQISARTFDIHLFITMPEARASVKQAGRQTKRARELCSAMLCTRGRDDLWLALPKPGDALSDAQ